MFSSYQPLKEEEMIRSYRLFSKLLSENEKDCFRLEEAAKFLDFSCINKSMRSKQPGEFKTFIDCVCKTVRKVIEPYLDKTTATVSYCDADEVNSLLTLRPIFPSDDKLVRIDKRIIRIHSFVVHIATEYKRDCANTSSSEKAELESARVKYTLDSEDSADEDDPTVTAYDKTNLMEQSGKKADPALISYFETKLKKKSGNGSVTTLLASDKTKLMKDVKHSNPPFLAVPSKRIKHQLDDDIPEETLGPSNGKERKFLEDDNFIKGKPVTVRSQRTIKTKRK